jgi:hypothetical protein
MIPFLFTRESTAISRQIDAPEMSRKIQKSVGIFGPESRKYFNGQITGESRVNYASFTGKSRMNHAWVTGELRISILTLDSRVIYAWLTLDSHLIRVTPFLQLYYIFQ